MSTHATTLGEFYALLPPDKDRRKAEKPFSEEITKVNEVLHDPFANDTQRRDVLESWLQEYQSCIFGRIAAKRDGIHYCFLTTEDILKSDEHIRGKIASSRQIWKQRALRGDRRHGFLLVVCDRKVCLADRGEALYQFALHMQQLTGWKSEPDCNGNEIVYESLYLRHPKTGEVVKFTFSVDFFAASGDGQWWHDHRIPGGIAFTANSLGHMVRYQEWYEGKADQTEWALRTAMVTIHHAEKKVPHGPATYLLEEKHGRPIKSYQWTKATKPSDAELLKGKDCGSYGGYLHTDHAVRREFFRADDAPITKEQPYLMDFGYIFDPASKDYMPFMGEPSSEETALADIGRPEDMRFIGADPGEGPVVAQPGQDRIESIIAECRKWRMTDEQLAELL